MSAEVSIPQNESSTRNRVSPYRRNVGRSKACSRCRDRKLRCDGARPHCTPCTTSWQRANKRKAKAGTFSRQELECKYNQPAHSDFAASFDYERSSADDVISTFDSSELGVDLLEGDGIGNALSSTLSRLLDDQKFVEQQVDIFLELYPSLALFHPETLHQRVRLPHGDPDRIHAAALLEVLEIMIALALAERPQPGISHEPFARHAFLAIMDGTHKGERFFDLTRALVLLGHLNFLQGDAVEAAISAASSLRLAGALDLLKQIPIPRWLEPGQPRIFSDSPLAFYPKDAIEAEEARRTIQLIFIQDTFGAAYTISRGFMSEEDYIAELPRLSLHTFLESSRQEAFNLLADLENSRMTLRTSNIITKRSDDAFAAMFNGIVLLSRCSNHVMFCNAPGRRLDCKDHQFRLLDSSCSSLQLSVTSSFEAMSNSGRYKAIWVAAKMIPLDALLILHEPLALLQADSRDMSKQACDGIMHIIRLFAPLAGTPEMIIHPVFLFTLGLVGRCLVRQLEELFQSALEENAEGVLWPSQPFQAKVSLLRAEVDVVLASLEQYSAKWRAAKRLHARIISLVQFDAPDYLRPLFCL